MKPLSLCLVCGLWMAGACDDGSGPNEPVPDPGRMHIVISGAVQHEAEWQAFGEFNDWMDTYLSASYFTGQNDDRSGGDSSLALFFPNRLEAGRFGLRDYATLSVGNVILDLGGRRFYSIDGWLDVQAADYPARPGLDPGLVRGTMTFRALDFIVAPTDTLSVRVTFNAHWYHRLVPNVSVTLSGGGPVVGTSLWSEAQSVNDDRGGRLVWWDANFGGGVEKLSCEISHEFRVSAPAVGTFPVARITPLVLGNPALWPARFSALSYRDDPRLALSTGGTLTITRFVPPTDAYYGEVHGTLASRLALWSNDTTVSADTVVAAVTFAVPLSPIGGVPAGAPATAQPRPPCDGR